MPGPRVVLLSFILCVFSLSVTIFYIHSYGALYGFTVKTRRASSAGFLVDTPGCKIPHIEPFDESVRKFIQFPGEIVCNATPSITYIDGAWLRISQTTLTEVYHEQLDLCEYQSIHRPDENSDNVYVYSRNTTVVRTDTLMTEEFIRVACYGKSGSLLSANFHAFILEKPVTRMKRRLVKHMARIQDVGRRPLSILSVGVDSISRLNFRRHLSSTHRYLTGTLGAVELQGYNKVADNTYVNLVPMFAGKFVEELPWNEMLSYKPFDEFSFIWKNFSDLGYHTLYAEDAPTIAIFNYAKEGFHRAPADFYLRPWSLALEDHGSIWRHGRDCVGEQLETELVLDYVSRFLSEFGAEPYFAFTFLTRLTHDNVNKARHADTPYRRFFQHLHRRGLLDNTAILFYSDHGMRFGHIRETYVGKLEERLPFMYLVFPAWFQRAYPEHMANLRTNAHRLTTPFDIYETLVDVLRFDGQVRASSSPLNQRGHSLFTAIPPERSCDHAAILPHWCTCHQQDAVSGDDQEIHTAAQSVVDYINQATEISNGLCARLRVEKVTDARRIVANDQVLHFRQSLHDVLGRRVDYGSRTRPMVTYSLTVRTQPGGGVFEATVSGVEHSSEYQVSGEISRINRYGNEGACIKSHNLRKFCHCL